MTDDELVDFDQSSVMNDGHDPLQTHTPADSEHGISAAEADAARMERIAIDNFMMFVDSLVLIISFAADFETS